MLKKNYGLGKPEREWRLMQPHISQTQMLSARYRKRSACCPPLDYLLVSLEPPLSPVIATTFGRRPEPLKLIRPYEYRPRRFTKDVRHLTNRSIYLSAVEPAVAHVRSP
jgi:hypothetical protein